MIQPERCGGTVTYEAANAALGHERAAGRILLATDYAYFEEAADEQGRNQFGIDYEYFLGSCETDSLESLVSDVADAKATLALDAEQQEDKHRFEQFESKVAFLTEVNRIVALSIEATDEPKDERYRSIAKAFAAHQEFFGVQEWKDSLIHTLNFLLTYRHMIEENILAHNWPQKLTDWRRQFVDYIRSPAARKLTSDQSVERVVLAVQTVPIMIDDPLNVLIEKRQTDDEENALGWFSCSKRIACVDPFAAEADIEYFRQNSSERLDVVVEGTLFHEFFHVITGAHYTTKAGADDAELTAAKPAYQPLWPRKWTESMTEKCKEVALGDVATDEQWALVQRAKDPNTRDWLYDLANKWRDSRARRIREALSTEAAIEMRNITNATYKEGRLLVDAFFAKLDWQAAGLTQEQAEIVGAYAFGETPEDGTDYRQQFIAAVNKAAHPGFFMKLLHAADHHSESLMTDVLLSNHFDPHDPHALPFTVTLAYYDHISEEAAAAKKAPNKQTEKITGRLALLSDAVRAEKTILETTHVQANTDVVLYGEGDASAMAAIFTGMLRGARRDIQRWRDEIART